MITDGFTLSFKERKIIQLYADGHTSKEAAKKMNIKLRTLEDLTLTIRNKCSARNIPALVAFALRHSLIE